MNPLSWEYGSPHLVWLLPLVFLVALLQYLLFRHRRMAIKRAPSQLVSHRSNLYHWIRVGCLCLAWVCVVFAIMQPRGEILLSAGDEAKEVVSETFSPSGESEEVTRRRKAHEIILLLDTSASMGVTDMDAGRSRLDYAKELVDEVISHLNGETVALYAFTSELTPISPSTHDYLFVRLQLRRVSINEGDVAGTDLVEALGQIRSRHLAHQKKLEKTVILLTDGGDTQLERLQGTNREKELQAILSRIQGPEEWAFQVYTVGLGTAQGAVIPDITFDGASVVSTLDEELLKTLASAGQGAYYLANDYSVLGVAKDIVRRMRERGTFVDEDQLAETGDIQRITALSADQNVWFDLFFQYPLALALIALMTAVTIPDRRGSAILAILLCPALALADEPVTDLSKATAAYEEMLSEDPTPRQEAVIKYNLATLALHQGDWKTARATLENLDPGDSDDLISGRDINLALARLYQAQSAAEEEQFAQAKQQLLQAIEEASNTDVIYALKSALVLVESQAFEKMLSELTEETGAKELANRLSIEANILSAIGQMTLSPDLQNQLLQEHQIRMKKHDAVWNAVDGLSKEKNQLRMAQNYAISASDRLLDGQLWPAREELATSSAMMSAIEDSTAGRDPLVRLLERRVRLNQQTDQASSGALKASLKTEMDALTEVTRAIVSNQVTTASENEQTMLRLLEKKLSTDLPKRAPYHQLIHQQIAVPLEESIAQLYENSDRENDSLLRDRIEIAYQKAAATQPPNEEVTRRLEELVATEPSGEVLEAQLEQLLLTISPERLLLAWIEKLYQMHQSGDPAKLPAEYEAIERKMSNPSPELAPILEQVQTSRKDLDDGLSRGYGQMFIESSKHRLRHLIEQLRPTEQNDPKQLLSAGIQEQQIALVMTQKAPMLPRNPRIRPTLAYHQQFPQAKVNPVPELLAEQQEAAQLVEEGLSAVHRAATLLETDPANWQKVVALQTTAIEKWEEALRKLDGEDDDDSEDSENSEQPSGGGADDLLELLQQMDREDQPAKQPELQPKQGRRPW